VKATTVIIRGDHNGQRASVTFVLISKSIWCATVECGEKSVEVRSRRNDGLRPCPTHAGLLLDEHFPASEKRRRAASMRRDILGRDSAARGLARRPRITIYDGG
jgi:hypothetical protein